MKIKKNDIVKVMTGKDRGKTGKVLRTHPTEERIVIEGVRLVVKHVRARKGGERGQRLYLPGRMPIANVQLVCPSCSKPTRVGIRRNMSGLMTRERFCKKCNATL